MHLNINRTTSNLTFVGAIGFEPTTPTHCGALLAAPRPEPLILQQKDTNITIIEKMMLP